jgi:hypothetical protein
MSLKNYDFNDDLVDSVMTHGMQAFEAGKNQFPLEKLSNVPQKSFIYINKNFQGLSIAASKTLNEISAVFRYSTSYTARG